MGKKKGSDKPKTFEEVKQMAREHDAKTRAKKAERKEEPPYDGSTPLKDKMEMFCQYYIGEAKLNASEAARLAGYSQKTAQRIGSENLSKPLIKARLAFLQRDTFKKIEVTTERIMEEVAKLAFSNLGDFITINKDTGLAHIDMRKATPDNLAALAQFEVIELPPFKTVENGEEVSREVIKVKIKTWDKLEALEKLMRRHNLVKPIVVEHNHKGSVALETPDLARKMAFLLRLGAEKTKQGEKTDGTGKEGKPNG